MDLKVTNGNVDSENREEMVKLSTKHVNNVKKVSNLKCVWQMKGIKDEINTKK